MEFWTMLETAGRSKMVSDHFENSTLLFQFSISKRMQETTWKNIHFTIFPLILFCYDVMCHFDTSYRCQDGVRSLWKYYISISVFNFQAKAKDRMKNIHFTIFPLLCWHLVILMTSSCHHPLKVWNFNNLALDIHFFWPPTVTSSCHSVTFWQVDTTPLVCHHVNPPPTTTDWPTNRSTFALAPMGN